MADVNLDLVTDACCLINLCAAQRILVSPPPPKSARPRRRIVALEQSKSKLALPFHLHIPSKVVQETLYIRKYDEEEENRLVEARIDLTPIVRDGLLHLCDLQDQAEIALFVQLATTLDDGEAMSIAIAKTRGWGLASDDRKARRLAAQLGVSVLTTAEMVKSWSENTSAADNDVTQVLQNIQTFARFIPHKTMPLHRWWLDAINKPSK
jgi:predicted nucleic acid-binding protein